MPEPAHYSSPDDTYSRRMIVNLTVTPEHECHVRSCELKDRNFRNRTSFGKGANLEQVFCGPVASALRGGIASLQGKNEVLSIPSLLVEIPGLTLLGIHLIVTKLSDARSFQLRFKIELLKRYIDQEKLTNQASNPVEKQIPHEMRLLAS